MKTVNNSAVYAVLSNIRLSHAERAAAVAALQDGEKIDRKSTRLNSSHVSEFRMPSSA